MDKDTLDPAMLELLLKLRKKYDVMGQDLSSYLDGLLHSDYITYWDYIHLDTLLSLQSPKTHFPDEKVFIVYHQITELYFNLILWEMDQVSDHKHPDIDFFIDRIRRINRYFRQLESSFSVMTEGLDKEQFMKFRMALLPSSGFQSAQYRLIEIRATDMINLVDAGERQSLLEYSDLGIQLDKLYWRHGATELASGKKTLTLRQFEEKYIHAFLEEGMKYRDKNVWKIYQRHYAGHPELIAALRELDTLSNIVWPLAHMRSAGHFLHKAAEDIKATGGTNWQKYLPPRFQKIMFFPDLWSATEKEEWGKAAFFHVL